MPIAAGQLNRKATFQRRAVVPTTSDPWGGFSAYGDPVWCSYVERRPREVSVGGLDMTARTATLAIRDSAWARTITRADRVEIDGDTFDVAATALADRADGVLRYELVEAETPTMYERWMGARGEIVTLRRESLEPAPETQPLRARVMGFKPEELASGFDQGDRKIVLLAEDLEREIAASRWPAAANGAAAILKNDTVMVRGAPMNVESVDDSTRRVAGVLIAYELGVTG